MKEKLKIIVYEDHTVRIEEDGKPVENVVSFSLECKEALTPCILSLQQVFLI